MKWPSKSKNLKLDLPAILRGAEEAAGDMALVRGAEVATGDGIVSVDFFENGEDDLLRNRLLLRRGERDKLGLRLLDLRRRFFRSRLSLLERRFLSFFCLVQCQIKIFIFYKESRFVTCLCCDASCDDGGGIFPESGFVSLACSDCDWIVCFGFDFFLAYCSGCAFYIEHSFCFGFYSAEFLFLCSRCVSG